MSKPHDSFITMENAEYHAHDALGSSDVRKLMVSPLHLKGKEEPAVRPSYFTFGSAVHSAYLEPDKFATEYRAKPAEVDGQGPRTKAYKEWMLTQPPCEWMSADDYDKVLKVVESALAHPISNELFKGEIIVEGSLFFKKWGVDCKARPDLVSIGPNGVTVLDLKTTTDASPAGFAKTVGNLGYHIQEWFYREALMANGYDVKRFIFLCVEKTPPYASAAYTIRQSHVQQACEPVRKALQSYKTAMETDVWEGYSTEVTNIGVPRWALPETNGFMSANWLDVKSCMKEFGISRATIYNWINSGAIGAKKVGGKRYLSARDLGKLRG